MSYQTVPTVNTGDLWTASQQNTYVRDNFAATLPGIVTTKGDIGVASAANTVARLAVGDDGQRLEARASAGNGIQWIDDVGYLNFWWSLGGNVLTTDLHQQVRLPAVEITEWAIYSLDDDGISALSGSIQFDLLVDSDANWPPVQADSICGGNEPALSSASKNSDATLTDWSPSISADSLLTAIVESATTVKNVLLAIKLKRV